MKHSELPLIELLFIQVPLVNLMKLLTVVYRGNVDLVLVKVAVNSVKEVTVLRR